MLEIKKINKQFQKKMKKLSYLFLFISLLILEIASILALLYCLDLRNFQNAVNEAETNLGFCSVGQTLCEWTPNNGLVYSGFSSIFSKNTSLILLDLIGRMEYETLNPTTPTNFQLIEVLKVQDSLNFVGIWMSNDTMFIVCRGTKTAFEWSQDFEFEQIGFLDLPGVLVHQGFKNIFNEFQLPIQSIIDTKNPTNIYFTGHSLGAAIATLLGVYAKNKSIPFIVYAFASPLVGNQEFAEQANSIVLRISNRDDLVTNIPLPVMINTTTSEHIPWIYARSGIDYSFATNWQSWTNNHFIPIYIQCLESSACELVKIGPG